MKRPAAFAALFLFFAGTNVAFAQPEKCPFKYDKRVRESLVAPAMRTKEGELSKLYYLERPGISVHDGIVSLIFWFKDITVLDPPNFIVAIDPCKRRVISAHETTPNL
jgi:hypothetical protein